MRGLFGLALLLGAATTLVDAGYYGLKLSEFEITKAGPGKVDMKGTAEGYCGEKTLTNFGESFKFDTTLNVQFYMNDTHDTSKYLLFEGTVSGPGSASVNTSAFCNMKINLRGTGTGPADEMPFDTLFADDVSFSGEIPPAQQINATDGKTVLQVVYNPAGESQTGYLVGTGTYHYTIKSETVRMPSVGKMRSGVSIRDDFVGFSLEWLSAVSVFRKPGTQTEVNPNVARLLGYLRHVHINVNGNTGMLTYLPWSTLPKLERSENPVTVADFQMLNKVMSNAGVSLVVGAPMLSTDPAYTADFVVNGILKYMDADKLFAIELGNEPDHWAIIAKKSFRPIPYTYDQYLAEYKAAENAILSSWPAGVPQVYFQGPAIAGCNTFASKDCWQDDLSNFAQVTGPRAKYISFHRYGNSGCSKYTNARTLLSDPNWNSGDFEFIARISPEINALGKELIWSEGNALSCGGKPGVSNSFAASLWVLDNLFESAVRGVKGMNVHTDPNKLYSPFTVASSGRITVLPVYYGMLQFHRLFDDSTTRVFRPAESIRSRWLKVWGTYSPSGKVRVIMINKDLQSSGPLTVTVDVGGSGNSGTVTRLTAPSYEASRGIRIAGQTFDGSTDGSIKGSFKSETVRRQSDGKFEIVVPPVSAAVLEFDA